ncbi:MAG: hypothetical protein KC505_07255 [Myxococcales bacterium]|nr:hypothetical protein [Myxococcales bacterium]USN51547.1 MAG: hypothetical protein H6731_03830 [Myxococcales bacterium]
MDHITKAKPVAKEKHLLEKREQDALFAVGYNFFMQGQYRQAKIIFDGLSALIPHEEKFFRAAQECKSRFSYKK